MPRVRKKNISNTDQPATKVDTKLITELSESTTSERVASINWFASQGEETKLEVLKKHADLIKQKRVPGQPVSPELSFALLCLAAKICRRNEEALAQKRALSVLDADEISRKRMGGFHEQKKTKGSPKLSKIRVQFFALISKLREQNYSWSDISLYLYRYHNFIATRAYIQQAFDKISKELEAGNGDK